MPKHKFDFAKRLAELAGDRAGELFGDDAYLNEARAYLASRLSTSQAAGLTAYIGTMQQAAA